MTTEHQRRAHELLRALQDAADMRRERDSMKAENKLLRQALEAMRELASVSTDGDGWYAEQAGLNADAIFTQAREALAGEDE